MPMPKAGPWAEWLRGAVFLWGAIAAGKLAAFAFQIRLGRSGGLTALGVAASIGTAGSFMASLSSLGLADRAMYRAATARCSGRIPDASVRSAHGLFLLAGAVGFTVLAWLLPVIVEDRQLRPFAWFLLIGGLANHLCLYSLKALRGLGEPAREAVATLVCSAIIAVTALAGVGVNALGIAFAMTGILGFALMFSATRSRPWLRPNIVNLRELLRDALNATPYFAIGTGCVVLGGVDVLLARLHGGSQDAGVVQCAAAVVRAGLYGPWMFGSLLVHRVQHTAQATGAVPRVALVMLGLGLAAIAVAAAWATLPWVLGAYGVPAQRVIPSAMVALCLAPAGYVALVLLPVATGLSLPRTALCVGIALVAGLSIGSITVHRFGVPGAIAGSETGYLVLAVLLLRVVLTRPAVRALGAS